MNDQPAPSAESNDPTNTMALRAGMDPADVDATEGVRLEAGALEALNAGTALLVVSHRQRVEHAELVGGDEVQIGKYRLTFHPAAGS